MKKIASFILKLSITTILLVLILEITFRVYDKINPTYIFPKEKYNQFRMPPYYLDYNGFKLNSKGFNDIEYPIKKTSNTFRIIGIGDSFVYGMVPYKDNFLTIIENKLNNALNNKTNSFFEIINMGISSTDPSDYYAILIDEGFAYSPDIVLCFYFIGNDFSIASEPKKQLYLFHFFKFFFRILPKIFMSPFEIPFKYDDTKKTFSTKTYHSILLNKDFIFSIENKTLKSSIIHSVEYLDKMKKECDKRNTNFKVIIIPDELQINPELQGFLIKESPNLNQKNTDFENPSKLLLPILESFQIPYFDLLPSFKKKSKEVNLYKFQDTHWNIEGNKLAAETLFKKLFLDLKLNDPK